MRGHVQLHRNMHPLTLSCWSNKLNDVWTHKVKHNGAFMKKYEHTVEKKKNTKGLRDNE